MEQLSLVDSMFLYLEDHRTPMHIGSFYILAPEGGNRKFEKDEFRQFMLKRIHLSPVFRRKLLEIPFNIARPYWRNDPHFNIDNHITHIALPEGSSKEDLINLVTKVYNNALDRSIPLWAATVITGLDGIEGIPKNGFALVMRVHHACIDGMSGAELQATLLDSSPEPQEVPPPKEEWVPEHIDSLPKFLAVDYARKMAEFPFKAKEMLENTGKMYGILLSSGISPREIAKQFLKLKAPRTLFNKRVQGQKGLGFVDLSLDRVKRVKNLSGVKVNDVMLAICSSGLRRYLLEKDALPEETLVTAAPVSVRTNGDMKSLGNKVTMMGVELFTQIADPLERLEKIQDVTKGSKIFARAARVESVMELIPSEVAASYAQVYTRMGYLLKYNILFNLIITNVPGSRIPLYINGFKVVNHYGMGITLDNLGIMIVIFSMENTISVSITACRELVPDVDKLARYIGLGLDELEIALNEKEEEHDFFHELADKYSLSEEQKQLL